MGSSGGTTIVPGQPVGAKTTAGQYVPSRDRILSNGVTPGTSGSLVLSYFTADRTETISTLTAYSGSTAAGATPTLCRMGVYSVAANGDLTLIGSTPNDTSLFAATNTEYPKAVSTPFGITGGVLYATALLVVTAAAMPNFHGTQLTATAAMNTISRIDPPFIGRLLGQTDLPASITVGSLVGFQAMLAIRLS